MLAMSESTWQPYQLFDTSVGMLPADFNPSGLIHIDVGNGVIAGNNRWKRKSMKFKELEGMDPDFMRMKTPNSSNPYQEPKHQLGGVEREAGVLEQARGFSPVSEFPRKFEAVFPTIGIRASGFGGGLGLEIRICSVVAAWSDLPHQKRGFELYTSWESVYLGKVLARKDLVFKRVHCDPPLFPGNPLFDISLIGLYTTVFFEDTDTMSKYTPMRFDVEKYDGRINFGLWQVQVKDVLIQSGLHKALKGKPAPVSSKESSAADDLDLRAASAIRLSLAKNVLANVHGISTAKELWEKLEQLYQGKGISNRLYLKEQFHTLRMNGDTKISDHLSVLNNIVSELEAIGVKVEDEDKTLRLILSLPSSYEHMKPILMYGKETLKYADVIGKLLSEEKRLESSGHTSSSEGMCGQSGHVKRNCPGGADSVKGSDTANMVSVVSDGDDFL
ncbi:hypothetical protein LXL04_029170 [Taraxacum kok-saghyz]